MIAGNLISDVITPLKLTDTGEMALNHMSVYHVRHLPILENGQFKDLVSEDILYAHDLDQPLSTLRYTSMPIFVLEEDHIFEVMHKMAIHLLTVIPVINRQGTYLGAIQLEQLLQYFASNFSFNEPGSIIVVETDRINFLMSDIARIAESEGANVMASFITNNEDSTKLTITLKLSILELSHLTAAYERYGYNVQGRFTEDEYEGALQSRYDSLMRYLDI